MMTCIELCWLSLHKQTDYNLKGNYTECMLDIDNVHRKLWSSHGLLFVFEPLTIQMEWLWRRQH